MSKKISIEDLEVGDTVWVDKEYGWCEVKGVEFSFLSGRVALTLSVAVAYSGVFDFGKLVTKYYEWNKTFKKYE